MQTSGQLHASVLVTGVVVVGLYACVLYQRRLQLKRHQMYLDGMLKVAETMMKIRKGR